MKARLYVITVFHNRKELTVDFAHHLSQLQSINYHLIAVDDGSTDQSAEAVEAIIPSERLTLLKGDGNLWWGGGLHRAWQHLRQIAVSDCDLVFISNDDSVFGTEDLQNLISEVQADEGESAVHARLKNLETGRMTLPGIEIDWGYLTYAHTPCPADPKYLPTRGLCLKAKTFIRKNRFFPKAAPHYFSDWIFTHLLYREGVVLKTAKTAYVGYHPGTTANEPLRFELPREKFFAQYFSPRSPHYLKAHLFFIITCAPAIKKLTLPAVVLFRFLSNATIYFLKRPTTRSNI